MSCAWWLHPAFDRTWSTRPMQYAWITLTRQSKLPMLSSRCAYKKKGSTKNPASDDRSGIPAAIRTNDGTSPTCKTGRNSYASRAHGNCDVEIAGEVADGCQSVITDQVSNGLSVRMAVLSARDSGTSQLMSCGPPQHWIRRSSSGYSESPAAGICCLSSGCMRPSMPRIARAGMFAHIRCDADIPMRRPLSIMRVNTDEGWVEFLYKIVGQGLRATRECLRSPIMVTARAINGFFVMTDRHQVQQSLGRM